MTIRVHHYIEKHGLPVCKYCGYVRNRDTPYPMACNGKLPNIETRETMDSCRKIREAVPEHERIGTEHMSPYEIAMAAACSVLVVEDDSTAWVPAEWLRKFKLNRAGK